MPIPIPSSVALVSARDTDPFAEAQWPLQRTWLATAVGPSRPTATTCVCATISRC
jgi:hypothetical protein